MDPVSGLKDEFFRPLVSVLIPGSLAASPFVLIAYKRFPEIAPVLSSTLGAGATILFCGVLAGMIMEDLGSRLELWIWKLCVKTVERDTEWQDYLRLKTKDELIGQRYLRTIQLRLKFELSIVPAIITFVIGVNWFNHLHRIVARCQMVWFTIALGLLAAYLLFEAKSSSELLAYARKQVIAACIKNSTPELKVTYQLQAPAPASTPDSSGRTPPLVP